MNEKPNLVAVAAYGDQTIYLNFLKRIYSHKLHIYRFGTTEQNLYKERWSQFLDFCQKLGKASYVGFSFGGTPIKRLAVEYPELLDRAAAVASPRGWNGLNEPYVREKYPMLAESLDAFDPENVPEELFETFRFGRDKTIPPKTVIMPNARANHLIPYFGHGTGIVFTAALSHKLSRSLESME